MTRIILKALNAPALILLTIVAVAIQTSLFTTWPFYYFQPDAVLLVTVWCAMNRGFLEGGILTLIVGQVAELNSSVPRGVFLATYMLTYLLVRGSVKIFVIGSPRSIVTVTMITAVFWKIATMTVLELLGANPRLWWHAALTLIPAVAAQAVAGKWAFIWLEKFDKATFRFEREDRTFDDNYPMEELLGP